MIKELIDEKLERDLRRIERTKEAWEETSNSYSSLLTALDKIALKPNCEISPFFDELLNIGARGDGALLTAIFRALRQNGFRCDGTRPAKDASSWASFFSHVETDLRVWVSFSSTVCKLKQVGTKTIEVPVYETDCGNQLSEIPDFDFQSPSDIPL